MILEISANKSLVNLSPLIILDLNIDKINKLVDDLIDSLNGKRKQIDHLKEQIEINVKKIDKIIEDHNANS